MQVVGQQETEHEQDHQQQGGGGGEGGGEGSQSKKGRKKKDKGGESSQSQQQSSAISSDEAASRDQGSVVGSGGGTELLLHAPVALPSGLQPPAASMPGSGGAGRAGGGAFHGPVGGVVPLGGQPMHNGVPSPGMFGGVPPTQPSDFVAVNAHHSGGMGPLGPMGGGVPNPNEWIGGAAPQGMTPSVQALFNSELPLTSLLASLSPITMTSSSLTTTSSSSSSSSSSSFVTIRLSFSPPPPPSDVQHHQHGNNDNNIDNNNNSNNNSNNNASFMMMPPPGMPGGPPPMGGGGLVGFRGIPPLHPAQLDAMRLQVSSFPTLYPGLCSHFSSVPGVSLSIISNRLS